MVYKENIEKLFMEEVREKKKIGTGAFHLRGKGVKHGFNGALRTPYHFMKTKERNKLNGEVETYNMFTSIIPYKEFELKDLETQKNLLTNWRGVFDNEKIMGEMKISNKRYFDLINELQLPKKRRGGAGNVKKGRMKKLASENLPISNNLQFELPEITEDKTKIKIEPQMQKIITKGLYLEYNGEYDAEALNKLFTKLQLVLDGELNKFNITLSLTEKVE
jgi:hypothetical protein